MRALMIGQLASDVAALALSAVGGVLFVVGIGIFLIRTRIASIHLGREAADESLSVRSDLGPLQPDLHEMVVHRHRHSPCTDLALLLPQAVNTLASSGQGTPCFYAAGGLVNLTDLTGFLRCPDKLSRQETRLDMRTAWGRNDRWRRGRLVLRKRGDCEGESVNAPQTLSASPARRTP